MGSCNEMAVTRNREADKWGGFCCVSLLLGLRIKIKIFSLSLSLKW